MVLLLVYTIINLIAFLLMYLDKQNARAGTWRIPEKLLFEIAALGGGVGGTVGMLRFRHKTKHWYFRFGFPILAGLQLVFLLYTLCR